MKQVSLGVDIGSISTKGVIIDTEGTVLAEDYLWTEGSPVKAVKRLIYSLVSQLPKGIEISSVGTTGSARRLIGTMLNADAVKNEITAHAVGTLSRYPNVRTILEIGGQDSKIILVKDGIVTDYAMNTLCAAGTGAFLSSQAKRLGVSVEEMGAIACKSLNPSQIAARCTVFAESDMIHKAQAGHKKEDLIAGLCNAVVTNYLNNVAKGKSIESPVVFQGGVSKNSGVVEAFRRETGLPVKVDEGSHLMGALGAAILGSNEARGITFEKDMIDFEFTTKTYSCGGCANQCEIISFYRNGEPLDHWGNRCDQVAVPAAVQAVSATR